MDELPKPPKSLWGPWSPDLIDPSERIAQLRCLRTLVHVLIVPRSPDYSNSVKTLKEELVRCEQRIKALEFLEYNEVHHFSAIADARALFDALPAARQRDIIATFAVLHKPLTPQKEE